MLHDNIYLVKPLKNIHDVCTVMLQTESIPFINHNFIYIYTPLFTSDQLIIDNYIPSDGNLQIT